MVFNISCASTKKPPLDNIENVGRTMFGELLYTVNVDTLEQLLEIAKIEKRGILVSPSECGEFSDWEITIYDHDIE